MYFNSRWQQAGSVVCVSVRINDVKQKHRAVEDKLETEVGIQKRVLT
jgi:hypothetical protein